MKVLCLAISSPRSHVNERCSDAGSLRIRRLSAATTAAVSLLLTLTRAVKRECRSPTSLCDCSLCRQSNRPPNDLEWRDPRSLQALPGRRWHPRFDRRTFRQRICHLRANVRWLVDSLQEKLAPACGCSPVESKTASPFWSFLWHGYPDELL